MIEQQQQPQQQPQQQQSKRFIPLHDVDLFHEITEPSWGKTSDVPSELRDKLKRSKYYKAIGDDGKEQILVDVNFLWEMLSYYTRDMRLANLQNINGEFNYCCYYLDLAGDCLREGYVETFIGCLARVVTRLELSQSRGGFFRKIMATVRQHNKQEFIEPKKTNLLGMKRKE